MTYRDKIEAELADINKAHPYLVCNPRHIEAYMLKAHGALSNLGEKEFRSAVFSVMDDVCENEAENSERLALAFGL